ncbi:SDR family oxidoreductase [Marivirga sp. S37H4]|uniref:SDR family oxidoreductase n=1 Tax=Marivirga aurantiaca TaxID=2802615 RepID=A0A934X2E0_9BACT|nr:SDR family oxidoreductase [Marivirga aurantiaca]MBK6267120.1 SDR family oxidoreductase [Marivirga aurantiaca]
MKKIAITGATSGIGLETAKALLEKGNHLIFLIRDIKKGKQMLASMPNAENVQIISCDLAELSSVKKAAEELLKTNDHLDVLINNAGGTFEKRLESKDGLELHFAINHLGHFLLVKELIPLLKKSHTKIINLSSEAHKAGKLDFNDIHLKNKYSTLKAYGNAKLCNVLFTKSLARKGFTSYSLHPGVIDSGFGNNLSGLFRLMWKLGKPFMKSPRQGASTSIYLALNELPKEQNGVYFKNRKPFRSSVDSRNTAIQDKLWEISEKLVTEKLGSNS